MSQISQDTIVARIDKTRRQIRIVELATVLVTLGTCLLMLLFAAVMLDHWAFSNGLPDAVRYLFFTVGVGAAAVYLAVRLIPMFRYSINPAYAAGVLEQSHRGMKNRLLNWIFLSREKQDASNPAAFQIEQLVLDHIERETAARLHAVPDQLIVDCTAMIRWGIVLAAVLALFCGYTIFSPKNVLQSSARAALPFLHIEPPQSLNFQTVEPGDVTLYQKEFLDVSVRTDRPANAMYFVYSTLDGRIADRRMPMNAEDGFRFNCRFPAEKQGLQESMKYRVESGNSRSKTYTVTVQPEISINVKSTEYRYPASMNLKPRTVENVGDLRAIEGTEATIIAKSNIPMNRAVLLLDNDSRREIRLTISSDKTEAVGQLTLAFDKEEPEKQICTSYTLRCWDDKNRTNPSPSVYRVEVLRAELSTADNEKPEEEKTEEEKQEQPQNPNEEKNNADTSNADPNNAEKNSDENGDGENENGNNNGSQQNKDAQPNGQAEENADQQQGNDNRPDTSNTAETNEAANQTQTGNTTSGQQTDSHSGENSTLNLGGGQQDDGRLPNNDSGSTSNQNPAQNSPDTSAAESPSGGKQSNSHFPNENNATRNQPLDGETNPGDVFEEVLNLMKQQNAGDSNQSAENRDAPSQSPDTSNPQDEPQNPQNGESQDESQDESKNDAAQSESKNRQQNGQRGKQEKTSQTGSAEAAVDPITGQPLTNNQKPDEIPLLHDDNQSTDQTGFYTAGEGNDPNAEKVDLAENDRVFEDPNDSDAGSGKANEHGNKDARPLDGKTSEQTPSDAAPSDTTPSEHTNPSEKPNAENQNPPQKHNQNPPTTNNAENRADQIPQNQSSEDNDSNPHGDSNNASSSNNADNSNNAQNQQDEDSEKANRNRIVPLQEYGHYHEREEKPQQENENTVSQKNNSSFFDRQADAANLEYAKQQTALAVKYLEEEVAKEHPNPQLLNHLGWNKDDLRRFVNRWKTMRHNAEQSPDADAERQWNETLRNIGLSQKSTVSGYQTRSPQPRAAITESQRYAPPKGKYEELMRAYTEGIEK
ncbi:MAG: hypothetical protein LBJ67_17370 [Planctomycetaceae bacterium]|jgi:hypothetical protein|nr:hypothetical protein [Planctomycetaceae bacterium]